MLLVNIVIKKIIYINLYLVFILFLYICLEQQKKNVNQLAQAFKVYKKKQIEKKAKYLIKKIIKK